MAMTSISIAIRDIWSSRLGLDGVRYRRSVMPHSGPFGRFLSLPAMLHSVETPLLPKKSRQTFCFKGTWLLAGAILLVFVFSPIHHRSPTFETEVAAFLDHASTKSICSSPSYRGPPCVLITGYGPFAQFQNNPA
eukprot:g6840.t1